MNIKRALLLLLALTLGLVSCGSSDPSKPGGLAVGDDAYAFSLPDTTGHKMTLKDVKPGWTLLLIFYRGHWCEACRNQLLDLKTDIEKYNQLHTAVACISVEDVATSAEFSATWKFPFPLLSDTSLEVIDAYGFRHPKGHEDKDISKPGIVIVSPQKKIIFKRLGHSPVDLPPDSDILEWIQQHPFPAQP
jgi:peroxiredoxin Q/BCP